MYNALCENTEKRSIVNAFNATKFCEDESSFLRWDPSLSCTISEESFDQKHWTSITRSQQMFRLTAYDENLTLKPLQCIGLDTYGTLYAFVESSSVNCTELRPFYCRYGYRPLINNASNEIPGHNVTMELPDSGHITHYITPGMIVGIVGSVIIILLITVVILVFMFRWLDKFSRIPGLGDQHHHTNEYVLSRLKSVLTECSRLIIGILALSAICNCDKDFNLTFYNESKTWSDAKDFCFVNGGILEADETIIRNYHDYTKDNVKLWLGAYSLITPWAGVFGCYFWNPDDRNRSIEFELQNKEQCQIRCPRSKYMFFAFKEKTCYCLNSETLPPSLDFTFHKKCSDSTETDYIFIYRQNLEPDSEIDLDTYNCIAVECKDPGRDRIFTAENCDSMYNVLCENTEKRSTINAFNATTFCEDEGSFVRWDPSLSCNISAESFDQKRWTSITRSQQIFRLTATDENFTLEPLQCIGLDTYGDLYTSVESASVNCTELRPFYCRYGSHPLINSESNESPGHDVSMELPDNSHNTRYLIPGAIAGTTLLAIIVGVVIFVFRRRSTERKADVRQDVQRSNNAEQIGHGKNLNRYSYSEVKVEGSNQHDNMNDDGDDQYTTGSSDVYDHLNENKNRKIKTENPHAIYDHAIGDNAESDYDSTKHVVPTNLDYQEVRIGSEEESLALN